MEKQKYHKCDRCGGLMTSDGIAKKTGTTGIFCQWCYQALVEEEKAAVDPDSLTKQKWDNLRRVAGQL